MPIPSIHMLKRVPRFQVVKLVPGYPLQSKSTLLCSSNGSNHDLYMCVKHSHLEFCLNPLTPTVAIWVHCTAIKHPVPDRVKPSFVIFDIRALWRSALSPECPDVKNCKWQLNPVWHRMLYCCARMAAVGIKGLNCTRSSVSLRHSGLRSSEPTVVSTTFC